METEPRVKSPEEMWADYGKLVLLKELEAIWHSDWNAQAVKIWLDSELEKLVSDE